MSSEEELVEKSDRKKNLAYKEFRVFTFPPKNTVLIVENSFTKNAKVVGKWWATLNPFERTVAVSTAMTHFDLPAMNFECAEDYDVTIDAAITYRVKGGEKPSLEAVEGSKTEQQIIKCRNKETRRKWHKEHGALKTYYDLENNPTKVQEAIKNAVYDAIRSFAASKHYTELKNANFPINDAFVTSINQSLDKYGIEIVDFKFKNVNQALTELDEAKTRKAIAEANAEALKIEADAEALKIKTLGEAEAKAEQLRLEAQVKALEGLDANTKAAILGKNVDLKSVNVVVPTGLYERLENVQSKTAVQKPVEMAEEKEEISYINLSDLQPEVLSNEQNDVEIVIDGQPSELFDEQPIIVEQPVQSEVLGEQTIEQPIVENQENDLFTEKESALDSTAEFDPATFRTPNPVQMPEIEESEQTIEVVLEEEPKVQEVDFQQMLEMVKAAQAKDASMDYEGKELNADMFEKVKGRR